jgi:hypothetical protein
LVASVLASIAVGFMNAYPQKTRKVESFSLHSAKRNVGFRVVRAATFQTAANRDEMSKRRNAVATF